MWLSTALSVTSGWYNEHYLNKKGSDADKTLVQM